MSAPANITMEMRQALFERVAYEARLLDEGRFAPWLDLFSDDGHYWIPLARDQESPLYHASLLYEDKLTLRIRVERLVSARAHSLQLKSHCLHVLQQPTLESTLEDGWITRTAFTYYETCGESLQNYGAVAWHRWVSVDDQLLLREKRVDLLNCDAALPSIQLFF